jgi:hypothetical protein
LNEDKLKKCLNDPCPNSAPLACSFFAALLCINLDGCTAAVSEKNIRLKGTLENYDPKFSCELTLKKLENGRIYRTAQVSSVLEVPAMVSPGKGTYVAVVRCPDGITFLSGRFTIDSDTTFGKIIELGLLQPAE